MKYVFIEGSAGVSGDMLLGALLDLGVPAKEFKKAMARLKLPVAIGVHRVQRGAMNGLKVDVRLTKAETQARTYADVESLVRKSPFSAPVKERSLAVFKALFKAEAKVHGRPFREAHLHEAGADDALVDVVGACFLLERLDIGKVLASALNVGSGWVKSAHGALPVPPPAVAELLKGIPVYSAWADQEMVTPTGAALLSVLVERFIPVPELCYERVGYGAGSRDLPGFSNILRVFFGRAEKLKASAPLYIIETNIDDASPQLLAAFVDKALELGALDATLTPVVMKKGRLASKLTLLAELDKIEELIAGVFRETTSIGVRYFPVERRVLDRSLTTVKVAGEPVAVKISRFEGRTITVQPEFSDCRKAAKKKGLPVKEVQRRALEEYWEKTGRE
jgi:uncharacterized protein (TIGR00299 family) protein